MTEKRFTLAYADYDWWAICDKENPTELGISDEEVVKLLNELYEENEQLKHDATVLIQANQDYRRENDKIKSLLLKKIKDLNNDYKQSARQGMPTGGIIGELDSFEEICEIMGWTDG